MGSLQARQTGPRNCALRYYSTLLHLSEKEPRRDPEPGLASEAGDHVACPKERGMGWRIKGEGKRVPRVSILETLLAVPTQKREGIRPRWPGCLGLGLGCISNFWEAGLPVGPPAQKARGPRLHGSRQGTLTCWRLQIPREKPHRIIIIIITTCWAPTTCSHSTGYFLDHLTTPNTYSSRRPLSPFRR